MMKSWKKTIGIFFLFMVVVNVWVFIQGVHLSDEIHFYEKELKTLKEQNIDFEKKVYQSDSLTYAASVAAQLDFARYGDPLSLTEPKYAYNK